MASGIDLFGVVLMLGSAAGFGPEGSLANPAALAKEHAERAFVRSPSPCLTPERLSGEVERLRAAHPNAVSVETLGTSFRGQDIRMLSIGHGAKSILLWSQMHGDEPSATPALLDLADFLARTDSPEVSRIMSAFTLRMIPMLNPDGAFAYERRNAQGIDINRDALMLATPEGRLLKKARDRFSPILGFNLHDQSRRTTVGDTGVLSTISLLAVAGDAAGTITPGRRRAKKVASRIVRTLSPFIPGGIARYDEDWNPRAFGDNLTAWGTPVVLIESGGFPKGGGFSDLTRLNFVALVSVLDGLAKNDLLDETPERYDRLVRNKADGYADVAIEGASLLDPATLKWFEADLVFDRLVSDQTAAGCAPTPREGSRIVEVGDSRAVVAGRRIDGRGMLIAPVLIEGGMSAGPIAREALASTQARETTASANPRELLTTLRLSRFGLTRNSRATFVMWTAGGKAGAAGRYVVVVDGVGLPDDLK